MGERRRKKGRREIKGKDTFLHALFACWTAQLARPPGSGPVAIFVALENLGFAPVSGIYESCPAQLLKMSQSVKIDGMNTGWTRKRTNTWTTRRTSRNPVNTRLFEHMRISGEPTNEPVNGHPDEPTRHKKGAIFDPFSCGTVARPGGLVL